MSDTATLIAEIERCAPRGMISLRADLSDANIAKVVKSLTKLDMPEPLRMTSGADRALCWMSPDELLILGPKDSVAEDLATLTKALGTAHALAVDVSDARALFRLSGQHARDVLAKLTPVDLSPFSFGIGDCRRTRIAQVAGAFWMINRDAFEIVCFRSVEEYMTGVLNISAQPGSEVNFNTV